MTKHIHIHIGTRDGAAEDIANLNSAMDNLKSLQQKLRAIKLSNAGAASYLRKAQSDLDKAEYSVSDAIKVLKK